MQRAHLCLGLRPPFSLRPSALLFFARGASARREMKIGGLNGIGRSGIVRLSCNHIRDNEPNFSVGQEVHIQRTAIVLIFLNRDDNFMPMLLGSIPLSIWIRA
ncbi:hypothetical protein VZ52_20920 [Ralstonia mannitolilytica]|nr:hypothetical protein VZ52_20920 [Ralstonia mannitolilytica]